MASASGGRAGLISAVAVLSIVSVTAMIVAFIFSADSRRNALELENLQKSYADVLKRNALTGPVVTALKDRRGREPFTSSDQLLDVAVRERDELAKLIGGSTAEAASVSAEAASNAAKSALTDAAVILKAAGLPEPSTSDNMAGTVSAMANVIASLGRQVNELTTAAKGAKSQAASTIQDTVKQLADKDKQIEDVRKQAAEATASAASDRAQRQGVIDEINKQVEATSKQMADAMQQLATKLADAQRSQQRVEKDLGAARQKLAMFRPKPDASQLTVRRADGTVSRIAPDGTVYISLGAGQQIVPGMTFEIYDKLSGVPPLGDDELSLPLGKGSIEVVRVSPNSSECRVVKTVPGRTMTEGDIIANLIYDTNTKYNFVVYGKFDLTKKGAPDSGDSVILKRLVKEWGGNLQEQVGVTTDFLVIGSEPTIPEFSDEQRRDPLNAKTIADAQAELDSYYAVLNKAKELYIPVLNQNRFLYYVGYFDLARK